MFTTAPFDPDHIKTLRWENWPHVLETQQFHTTMLESFMLYVCWIEQQMKHNRKLPQLSSPVTGRRRLTFSLEEPSTRTEATFQEASKMLGFDYRSVHGDFSSASKGESVVYRAMAHTQVAGMWPLRLTDYYVIRSKYDYAANKALQAIEAANEDNCHRLPLPVINAGDGQHQHPTQAFTDLASIYAERSCSNGRSSLDDLTLVIVGDVSHGRTANSLCHLIGKFACQHAIKIIFCTHPSLGPKPGMISYLERHGVEFDVTDNFEHCLRQASVVYITRIQRERFEPDEDQIYTQAKRQFVLKPEHLDLLQSDAFVLHPLPINIENALDGPPEIDVVLSTRAIMKPDKQCAWARQSHRNLIVRFALLDLIEYGLQQLSEYGPALRSQ